MRIIAGRFKRRQIKAPPGHLTRPTTDRTRESAFNLLESRMSLAGAAVLDLFAGSGAMGLEALSRGASHATFVESDGRVLAAARENAQALGVDEQCTFLRMDALSYLKHDRGESFDVVFADPPYHLPSIALLPELVLPHVAEGGLFLLEHDARISMNHHPRLDTSRPYGKTVVSIFDAEVEEDGGLDEPESSDRE